MIEFGPCPEGEHCDLQACDGTDLGHALAVDFPEETDDVDAALATLTAMMPRSVEDVPIDPDLLGTPPVLTAFLRDDDVEDWLRAEMIAMLVIEEGVPLSRIDGRPWVPTHREAHPAILWGNGLGLDGVAGCGHDDCLDGPVWAEWPRGTVYDDLTERD